MLTPSIYMYLTSILILFIAGNIVQWVYFNEDKKKNEEKKKKENFEGDEIPLNKIE